jgi:hypothetical protein
MKPEILTKYCQNFIRIPGETGHEKDAAHFLKNVMEELKFDETFIDEWGGVTSKFYEKCFITLHPAEIGFFDFRIVKEFL